MKFKKKIIKKQVLYNLFYETTLSLEKFATSSHKTLDITRSWKLRLAKFICI